MWHFALLLFHVSGVLGLHRDAVGVTLDYYVHKHVEHVCYFSCDNQFNNKVLVDNFMRKNIRVSVRDIDRYKVVQLEKLLYQWNVPVGVLLDGACDNAQHVLDEASKAVMFDAMHMWLVITDNHNYENCTTEYIDKAFQELNLSVDTDIVVAFYTGDHYKFVDVFNFGKIQGNNLEKNPLGIWSRESGVRLARERFKYYSRWCFNNLTLRAVSVILDRPKVFTAELLTEPGYTPGVASMTKVVSNLLNVLKQKHNFRIKMSFYICRDDTYKEQKLSRMPTPPYSLAQRDSFNYTIVGRWIGSPERNSTLAVTNTLYWREQDISSTCARLFPKWLEWVDPFFPPATRLETKFYYLIPNKGAGDYENRFLTPMSPGVWWCACAVGFFCMLVLAAAAALESRPEPGLYAIFSVIATTCQQEYEDGVQVLVETFSSQGRRLTLLVVGLTSMLLYNYYTSSVVSWLLNAASPTIDTLDGLINSDYELVFEDIGYTRGWLDNPGFFYYSGFKNVKEDELRTKKVQNAKRTVELLQPAERGIKFVRTGGYAYHTEPYTASQVISRTFDDRELCDLGSLQMMKPAHVYVMGQKRSPYKQFFVWSMMRLLERGHISVERSRVGGVVPECSGRTPRALALGQAAPAFVLLAVAALISIFILLAEIIWYRIQLKTKRR